MSETKPSDLGYWTGIPGRDEFVRLPLEAAAIAYRDRAREGGDNTVIKHLKAMKVHSLSHCSKAMA
jgi:glutathione S-transferase